MTHNDQKEDGCCGGNKNHDHSKLEKDDCCDNKDKKPETDKAEQQDGCCGSKK